MRPDSKAIKDSLTNADDVWKHICKDGIKAVEHIMDYLDHIEGQNRRLNKRLELLELMVLHVDLFGEVLKKLPETKKRYESQSVI